MLLQNEIFWYKNLMKGCNDLNGYWLPNLSINYSFAEDLYNYWRSEVSSPDWTPDLSGRRLDGYGLPTGTYVIEEQSPRSEERIQNAANYSTPDSVGVMKNNIKDAEQWSDEPNGDQIDKREDQRPDQSQRNGDYGSDYAIEPESGGVEEQVSQAPNKLKAMSRIRFSDHVFE